MLLLKEKKGVNKVKWFKKGKCNKVPKLKEVVHVPTDSMLYMQEVKETPNVVTGMLKVFDLDVYYLFDLIAHMVLSLLTF